MPRSWRPNTMPAWDSSRSAAIRRYRARLVRSRQVLRLRRSESKCFGLSRIRIQRKLLDIALAQVQLVAITPVSRISFPIGLLKTNCSTPSEATPAGFKICQKTCFLTIENFLFEVINGNQWAFDELEFATVKHASTMRSLQAVQAGESRVLLVRQQNSQSWRSVPQRRSEQSSTERPGHSVLVPNKVSRRVL